MNYTFKYAEIFFRYLLQLMRLKDKRKKEGIVLFKYDYTPNTFYLWLYGFGHVIKDHSGSERDWQQCIFYLSLLHQLYSTGSNMRDRSNEPIAQ